MIRRAILKALAVASYQVTVPEPSEVEARKMHNVEDYGLMRVKLYGDIGRQGDIAAAYAYPVEERRVMNPSPIPKLDKPKLEMVGIQLLGAGPRPADLCYPAPQPSGEPRF